MHILLSLDLQKRGRQRTCGDLPLNFFRKLQASDRSEKRLLRAASSYVWRRRKEKEMKEKVKSKEKINRRQ